MGFFKVVGMISKGYNIDKAKEKHENNEFIGCSRYPKCRYTEKTKKK